MRYLSALLGLLLCSACLEEQDVPSRVRDLRVLAIQMDPPELYFPTCSTDPAVLASTLARPVRLTALIPDPAGDGRELEYVLAACSSQNDDTCEEDRVELKRGVTRGGVLDLTLFPGPGAALLPDGTPLIQRVLEEDTYRGLGGVRLPLVLEVRGGDERIFASKLMVYDCAFFPEMKPNVQPVLPDPLLEDESWVESVPRELSGPGPFRLEAPDFSALEEPYVVRSFELKPVPLVESWQLSWHTTLGTLSPDETGGADPGGGEGRHRVEWQPPRDAQAQEVRFWVVVRDGRGGTSWISRTVRYTP
ncbi:hypothetical protein [Cystobacter fuscus]|uniref:hypothetical protein n=1 Tax=Cystobacter fuscus TaxID=43 RepID=UPI002B311675|nr:hypothetical protein F0U63_38275 [Cystobacter fuscus]